MRRASGGAVAPRAVKECDPGPAVQGCTAQPSGTVTESLNSAVSLAAVLHERIDRLFASLDGGDPCGDGCPDKPGVYPIEAGASLVRESLVNACARLDGLISRLG